MHVASLELCKTLFELSGWGDDTDYTYYANAGQHSGTMMHRSLVFNKPDNLPAYDLGYLLRKLPETYEDDDLGLAIDLYPHNRGKWECGYEQLFTNADTPEDAACKLAIELFKQGILTKENA